MEETKSNRLKIAVTVVALLILALSGLLPSFTYVRVSGPDGEIEVQNAGRGPQRVKVSKGDVQIESMAR